MSQPELYCPLPEPGMSSPAEPISQRTQSAAAPSLELRISGMTCASCVN